MIDIISHQSSQVEAVKSLLFELVRGYDMQYQDTLVEYQSEIYTVMSIYIDHEHDIMADLRPMVGNLWESVPFKFLTVIEDLEDDN